MNEPKTRFIVFSENLIKIPILSSQNKEKFEKASTGNVFEIQIKENDKQKPITLEITGKYPQEEKDSFYFEAYELEVICLSDSPTYKRGRQCSGYIIF